MPDHSEQQVREAIRVLNRVRQEWMRRPGVSAVDVGYPVRGGRLDEGVIALRAHVERKRDDDKLRDDEIFNKKDDPREIDGFPIDVLEVDYEPSASSPEVDGDEEDEEDKRPDPRHLQRLTPLVGGVSVGNPRVTAGTLGAVVWDRSDGSAHILSNWHVLAGNDAVVQAGGSSPSGTAGQPHYQPHYQSATGLQPHYQALAGLQPHYQLLAGLEPHYQLLALLEPHYQSASSGQPFYQAAGVGEPIYQPGRFDGGTAVDTVAHLTRARLDRHMDAAIARLTGVRPYSPHILGIGLITGVTRPRLGMRVVKSGRSSGVTRGRIDGLGLSTTIKWANARHYFTDQIHIVPLDPWPERGKGFDAVSEGGDSGSVWVEEETGEAIGLHFAGDVGGVAANEHALANPLHRVEEALEISFAPDLHARAIASVWPEEPRLLRVLANLGGGPRGDDLPSLVKAVTATADGGGAGSGLSRQELEALRAVIDVVLARGGR